jgi:hypothetical protein
MPAAKRHDSIQRPSAVGLPRPTPLPPRDLLASRRHQFALPTSRNIRGSRLGDQSQRSSRAVQRNRQVRSHSFFLDIKHNLARIVDNRQSIFVMTHDAFAALNGPVRCRSGSGTGFGADSSCPEAKSQQSGRLAWSLRSSRVPVGMLLVLCRRGADYADTVGRA